MRVKVIIHDGITTDVLTDSAERLEVEILDIDKDYSDYDELEEYEESLLHDPGLSHVDYTTAHFDVSGDE